MCKTRSLLFTALQHGNNINLWCSEQRWHFSQHLFKFYMPSIQRRFGWIDCELVLLPSVCRDKAQLGENSCLTYWHHSFCTDKHTQLSHDLATQCSTYLELIILLYNTNSYCTTTIICIITKLCMLNQLRLYCTMVLLGTFHISTHSLSMQI